MQDLGSLFNGLWGYFWVDRLKAGLELVRSYEDLFCLSKGGAT